jgi:hypothetical protein
LSRSRRASVVLFAVLAAAVAGIGTDWAVAGYIAASVSCFGIAGLIAVIGLLAWINWRALELNRDLIRVNGDLSQANQGILDLNQELLERLASAGERARYDESCD